MMFLVFQVILILEIFFFKTFFIGISIQQKYLTFIHAYNNANSSFYF